MNRRVGTEPKTMLGWPLYLRLCFYIQLYLTNYDAERINKIPKCFSCPGDCKELSKKTRRSTHDANPARTKPWPTRWPTSNNNLPITKRIRTNDTLRYLSNLDDCSGLSKEARRWNSRNQGSSQLTIWQWLTRVECKLTKCTSQTMISKQTKKKKTPRYQQLFKTSGEGRKGPHQANTTNTFRALLLR